METGFNLQAIREALDGETWEEREYGEEGSVRRVYLGTVFSLTPSGKYYLPFACSNVEGCPQCKGAGSFPAHRKRRIVKKWAARNTRRGRKIDRMRAQGTPETTVSRYYRAARYIQTSVTCEYCAGCGSREAHLDEVWRELAEEEMESIGASLENGEGDPCDLFACEYRDEPAEEEEEEEEATA